MPLLDGLTMMSKEDEILVMCPDHFEVISESLTWRLSGDSLTMVAEGKMTRWRNGTEEPVPTNEERFDNSSVARSALDRKSERWKVRRGFARMRKFQRQSLSLMVSLCGVARREGKREKGWRQGLADEPMSSSD